MSDAIRLGGRVTVDRACLRRRHDIWLLISFEPDAPSPPDVLVELVSCICQAPSLCRLWRKLLKEQPPPALPPLRQTASQTLVAQLW